MNAPRFAVGNRWLVNILFWALMIWGVLTYQQMPRSEYAEISLNEVVVWALYPGATPEEVEQFLAVKLEEAIEDVARIDQVYTVCREGAVILEIFLDDELSAAEVDDKLDDIRAEILDIPDLPAEVETVHSFEIDTAMISPVLQIALGGPVDGNTLREVAEDVRREILALPGIHGVELGGEQEREIHVEADPARLDRHGLTLLDLVNAIAADNVNVPAGHVDLERTHSVVRSVGQYGSVADIGRTVVTAKPTGEALHIGDVAAVRDTLEELTAYGRLNGEMGINLTVMKESGANLIGTALRVREAVNRLLGDLQLPIDYRFRVDSSKMVARRLVILENNALLGGILVVVALWLLVGLRGALLAAVGIPFTFLTAFIFMAARDITINMTSIFALILVLGIVVDDAIMIIENAYRHRQQGKPRVQAAVEGTEEIMYPVMAAALTTVLAFVPMLRMTGMIGRFIEVIPVTVMFALIASLLEALLVLPAHLVDFGGEENPAARSTQRRQRAVAGLQTYLRRRIRFGVRRPWVPVSLVLLAATGAVFVMFQLEVGLFPEEEVDQIHISGELPPGVAVSHTEEVARQCEAVVSALPADELAGFTTTVGWLIDIATYRSRRGTHLFQINVDLQPFEQRARSSREIIAQLRDQTAGITGLSALTFELPNTGPPEGKPVEVHVLGDDFGRLRETATELMAELRAMPGVHDVRDDLRLDKAELRVRVDKEQAARLGVTAAQIGWTVRAAFHGCLASTYRGGRDDEIDILVKIPKRPDLAVADMQQLKVRSIRGELVPLSAVTTLERGCGYEEIRRYDNKRSVTITADVDPGVTSSTAVNQSLARRFAGFGSRYPGLSLEFGGEFERTQESMRSMFESIGLAIVLIFLVLAIQFRSVTQPLVILFTVPFSLIGVIIGLVVMDLDLTLSAMIAVLALCGLVVNASIVLVDFANKRRERGQSLEDAISEAAVIRARPVLLTAVTTILGLLPMATGLGGTTAAWQPMSIALIWGLGTATLLTLFVIPAVYMLNERILGRLQGLVRGLSRS